MGEPAAVKVYASYVEYNRGEMACLIGELTSSSALLEARSLGYDISGAVVVLGTYPDPRAVALAAMRACQNNPHHLIQSMLSGLRDNPSRRNPTQPLDALWSISVDVYEAEPVLAGGNYPRSAVTWLLEQVGRVLAALWPSYSEYDARFDAIELDQLVFEPATDVLPVSNPACGFMVPAAAIATDRLTLLPGAAAAAAVWYAKDTSSID